MNKISQLQHLALLIKNNIPMALLLIGVLWVILVLNALVHYRLNIFGIYPRRLRGFPGIFLHPLLHGSFNHLFFNSIPLFVMLTFVLIYGMVPFVFITLLITILSGLATWLFGRNAIHVGASGLIMGYWGYLLVNAYVHPSILTYALGIVLLYYFGGLVLSIFPSEEKVSWEGHLFGLLAGITTAFLYPPPLNGI